ncbi:unnamed protein product, partial [marine sediment metagenome]
MSARKIWLVVVVAIVLVAVVLWILHYCGIVVSGLLESLRPWIQTIALVATAVIVWKYTRETADLRKAAQEQVKVTQKQIEEVRHASELDALTKVHQQLNSKRSCRMRQMLQAEFPKVLAAVAKEVLGEPFLRNEHGVDAVSIANVLRDVKRDEKR